MKKVLLLLLGLLVASAAFAADPVPLKAYTTQTNADTASVLLRIPHASQTILIRRIRAWVDNAANSNPVHVGIVTADDARTRQFWAGQTQVSGEIHTWDFDMLNIRITPSVAQAGVLLFVSATSSDSVAAEVEYEFVSR